MDVFARLDETGRRSLLLGALLVVSLVAIGLAVHLATLGATAVLGGSASLVEPSGPAVALVAVVWASVALGSLFAWLDVRAGGAVLARRLGAVQASDRARHGGEARLLRAVAEMSIAASVPRPEAFVLRDESAINAMVLGTDAGGRRALVVTAGALEALDDEALLGVVAHEIAHVSARDLTLNMRLLVAFGGLGALDGVGRTLTGLGAGAPLHPGTLVGWALRILGTLTAVPAWTLRAALSRARELHADALAVQFTRSPFGLASALAAVRDAPDPAPLHLARAGELVHLCFSDGVRPWWARALATHPSPDARIDAIEPHFEARRRSRERRSPDADPGAEAGSGGSGAGPAPGSFGLALVRASGARPGAPLALDAGVGAAGPSDRILLLLGDERSCLAALFALFAPAEPLGRRAFLDRVAVGFDRGFADAVAELLDTLGGELRADRLGVVRHACAALVGPVHLENRRRVLLKLERAAASTGPATLESVTTLALVRRLLAVEFPRLERLAPGADGERAEADGRRSLTFDRMGGEFALLLSLVAEASGASPETVEREYLRTLACYTAEPLARRRADEPGIGAELEDAFATLAVQPKPIRQAFLRHAAEICLADGRVTGEEVALVALFAAALDCEELLPGLTSAAPAAPRAGRGSTTATALSAGSRRAA